MFFSSHRCFTLTTVLNHNTHTHSKVLSCHERKCYQTQVLSQSPFQFHLLWNENLRAIRTQGRFVRHTQESCLFLIFCATADHIISRIRTTFDYCPYFHVRCMNLCWQQQLDYYIKRYRDQNADSSTAAIMTYKSHDEYNSCNVKQTLRDIWLR